MRLRLAELLAVLTLSAFAMAALVRADGIFECLFFSFTLTVLFVSLTLAIGDVVKRRFWLAFTFVGWAYLGLSHFAGFSEAPVKAYDAPLPRHNGPEITTQILRFALAKLHPTAFQPVYSLRRGGGAGGGLFNVNTQFGGMGDGSRSTTDPETLSDRIRQPIIANDTCISFMRAGHCTWALLFAWIAGHLACSRRNH